MLLDGGNKMAGLSSPLGDLPDGWRLAKLKQLTKKIGSGATPRGGQSAYLPIRDKFALVRSQNIFDRRFDAAGLSFISDAQAQALANAQLQRGDVLLNITGDGVTFGRACAVPEEVLPACVNQHVSVIRPDEKNLLSGYLLGYLTHPEIKSYVESFNSGGSRRAITKGHIESFVVPLPPVCEQTRIASILGVLDDKIEINRRMNKTLEEMAQALFKSWFVDFDPVQAKAAGRKPFGMVDTAAALFPPHFEESKLGPIPQAWSVAPLGESFEITMGQSPPGESFNELGEGLPFFQGRTDFGFRFPSRRMFTTQVTRLAQPRDTLVSVRAPVGDVNMAAERCCIGRGLAAVRHKAGNESFTFYAMQSLKDEFAVFEGDGTLFGSISGGSFRGLRFVCPSAPVREQFEAQCCSLDEMIRNNESQSQTLERLRDLLLPKLLSGEIRLRDAGRQVEAAL